MSDEIIRKQVDAYRSNFLAHGNTPKGTFQNNTETQFLRFERLISNVAFEKDGSTTLHDIGSGVCDLHGFLLERNIPHVYSGTEIVDEMIQTAHKKYPNIELFNRDLLTLELQDVYDFVVLSGTFNIPGQVPAREWKDFCQAMIKKMFMLSKKGIAFNFLTTESTFTDPVLFYQNPSEMLTFCQKNLSRFVTVDHAYPLYEVTVTVFKKGFMKEKYSSAPFEKYFKN